eukprot:scaffold3511_cov144-Skeletonema_dohrnii-CCMP3373.AAC.1
MSPTEKRKAASAVSSTEEADPSSSSSSSAAKKSRADVPETTSSNSITDVVSHLHNLLQTKEKELKEREADFDRRVKSFESTHPSIGSDNDVIQLNVGGQTNIAVLRNTLTQFEDSMLAAKFSGRWDDSMEKDRDGNIFVDEDPDNFKMLLKFLRMRMKNNNQGGSSVPERHRPKATYEFCSMLEYYNLMQGVYGHTWVGEKDAFTCKEIAYGTVSLCSKTSDDDSTPKLTTVVFPHKSTGLKLNEFTVEFEKGASGVVGWVEFIDDGANTAASCINFARSYPRFGIFLNIAERKAYGPRNNNDVSTILGENLRMNHTETATKLVCQRVGGTHKTQRKYSIELADGTKVDTNMIDPPDNQDTRVMPVIAFSGKVTVSGLRYAIDEL